MKLYHPVSCLLYEDDFPVLASHSTNTYDNDLALIFNILAHHMERSTCFYSDLIGNFNWEHVLYLRTKGIFTG